MTANDPAEPVLLRRDEGGIAFLTLNRPAARNALSVALMGALEAALEAIGADPAVKSSSSAAPARRSAPATICASCAPIRGGRPMRRSSRMLAADAAHRPAAASR